MTASRPVVLLVEDNPDDVELTQRAFERAQVAVTLVIANDALEALDQLHGPNPVALPEVVLLDLNLPKLTGHELLRRLRGHQRTRLLPVVILTTSLEERDVVECYEAGANSYVAKPVDFNQFVEAARCLAQYWSGVNHPAHRVPGMRLA